MFRDEGGGEEERVKNEERRIKGEEVPFFVFHFSFFRLLPHPPPRAAFRTQDGLTKCSSLVKIGLVLISDRIYCIHISIELFQPVRG